MPKERIHPKIWAILTSHPKIKAKPQVIRNQISDIRRKNAGVTLNAAAHVLAERRGFSLMRYLDEKDRASLQYVQQKSSAPEKGAGRVPKIKVKEIEPSFGGHYINEANKNAQIYPYIYILENSLRQLILEKFRDEGDWWNNKKFVHKDIQDYSKRVQDAESKHRWLPRRGTHPIYYVGLYELFKIIEKNWNPHFKDVFDDLGDLRTWIKEIVPIRNLVAHNVQIRKQDQQNVQIRTEYICTMIENLQKRAK